MSMQVEMPLFYDVAALGTSWQAGDYAVYSMYSDESMTESIGTHKLTILKLEMEEGVAWSRVRISREDGSGQRSDLEFSIAANSLDLSKAKDILMVSGMGRFQLSSFSSRPGESIQTQKTLKLEVMGQEMNTVHHRVTYTDGQGDCELWSAKGYGPYGVAKAIRIYGKTKVYYKLIEAGKKSG